MILVNSALIARLELQIQSHIFFLQIFDILIIFFLKIFQILQHSSCHIYICQKNNT
jgi:hypothetical protein